MPVVATPTSTITSDLPVTSDTVRLYLRDRAEFNILLKGELQFNTTEILEAIKMACSAYNAMAPVTNSVKLDGTDWPAAVPHLLVLGTTGWLLLSEANKQVRNQLNSQDGNIPRIGIDDKQPQYIQHGQMLWAEFRDAAQRYKQLLDIEQARFKLVSPLRRRGRWL